MLIDWFTVGAQALNFLILVWLMKRYLYKPVLKAIEAREKRIAAQIAAAEAKEAAASKERDDFQHKNEEFDKQRADLLTKATDDAKVERKRLMEEARTAADAMSAKREESLKNEAKNLTQAITQRTQKEVFAIARKTLGDLATSDLDERIVDVFTRRLQDLDGPAKAKMAAAAKATTEPAVVRSAFDLAPELRSKVHNAINVALSADVHLRFETAPGLVAGIELDASGQKLAWSIAEYLTSLEMGVGELLKKLEKPEPTPEPKPESDAKVEAENKTEEEPESASKPKSTPDEKVKAEESEPASASS